MSFCVHDKAYSHIVQGQTASQTAVGMAFQMKQKNVVPMTDNTIAPLKVCT